jgi:hypothetical protein
MPKARRQRAVQAMAISLAAHAALLTVLALHAPILQAPPHEPSFPVPIIPVLIMPRLPPPTPGEPPDEIRLHRRPQPFAQRLPVAPLPVPETPRDRPSDQPRALPQTLDEPPPAAAEVRAVLRAGALGCANPSSLSQAERERCLEGLGRGAGSAPYIAPGGPAEKQAAFAAAAAAKAGKRAPIPPPGPSQPSSYDGEPYTSGAGASALGPVTYPTDRRAAQKLNPLPP